MPRPGRQLAMALAAVVLLGASPPAGEDAAARRVQAHVGFLSSDLLEGRESGSRGHAVAAAYVAGQFQALGLQPGANGSWYQTVRFRRATHKEMPSVVYTEGGKAIPLAVGTDAGVRPSVREKVRTVEAPLLFVGRGISDAKLGIDDYAGLDARGKIVVALTGAPSGIASDVAAHLDDRKDETAVAKGAVGYVEIDANRPYIGATGRGRPRTDWVAADGSTGTNAGAAQVQVGLSEAWSQRLFAKAPRRLDQLRADAAAGRAIRGFVLPGRFRVQAESHWEEFTSPQVAALLPGSDPALRAEHVVLLGHLDHLGLKEDAQPGEDSIYNGAMDNAAGIATLIEAARSFVESGRPPRRSVLFLAVTGEEIGLLGADYFAARPTIPLDRIAALVNLDMPLLHYDFTDVVAFGAEHSSIAPSVAEAGRSMGVALGPDPMPEEALFVRSDHYPFVLRGVPATFLMTGHANGGAEVWRRFLASIYHKPNDDLSQPISWRSGARFAELNYRIARTLADGDRRPRWYPNDYFGDSFASGQERARCPSGGAAAPFPCP